MSNSCQEASIVRCGGSAPASTEKAPPSQRSRRYTASAPVTSAHSACLMSPRSNHTTPLSAPRVMQSAPDIRANA